MGFPPPPVTEPFSYTTPEPATVAVMPGALRVPGPRTISAQRIQFATGKGPSGGSFTGRWLRNGTSIGTITVTTGNVAGSIAAPANSTLADGDVLTFEVLGLGGATGAAVGILDVV